MGKVATLLLAAAASAAAVASAAGDSFWPAAAPTNEVRVAVRVLRNNMPIVEGTLDGRPCTLLFDTGATHTTFDLGFVKREFPDAKLEHVLLAGATNVEKQPQLFNAGSLKIGEAEFAGFSAMALDISHLAGGVGVRIDGIAGMNVIGRVRTLVSLGGKEIFFAPSARRLDGFTVAAKRRSEDPFTIAFRARYNDRPVDIIVDSAASFTFLDEALGWPTEGDAAGLSAVNVNGGASIAPKRGAPGQISAGIPLAVSPLVVAGSMNCIGSDVLQRYDMVVEPGRVAFRRHAGESE